MSDEQKKNGGETPKPETGSCGTDASADFRQVFVPKEAPYMLVVWSAGNTARFESTSFAGINGYQLIGLATLLEMMGKSLLAADVKMHLNAGLSPIVRPG